MAELADAHGSGPCESNFMEVQVLLAAPKAIEPAFLRWFYFYLHDFYTILFKILIARSSSRGYKWL